MKTADLVIKGNAIFDGTGELPFAGGVAVRENKILAVIRGDSIEEYIGEKTKVIDAGNGLILPGFNDGHTHITQGAFLEDPDFSFSLASSRGKEEAIQMCKRFADSHPDNEYIYGSMMNNLSWEDPTLPTCADIDAVIPDRPVIMQMFDLHTIIVNSAMMKKRNMSRDTQDLPDGVYERDEQGELTGRCFDGASFQTLEPLFDPSDDVYMKVYENISHKMARLGITSCSLVTPFTAAKDPTPYFAELDRQEKLVSRVMIYPNIQSYEKENFKALQEKYPGPRVKINGLKQLIDGVTAVFTASMLSPYYNNPDTCGCNSVDMEEFRQQALEAMKDGVPLRIHTIGDKAVRDMLDIFEEGERLYGKQGLRHVQEHLETVDPADMPRFAKLGIAGCVQPWHVLIDLEGGDKGNGIFGDKEATVGPEKAPYCWPFRDLLDAGMIMSIGSDYPVVDLDPMKEIYGAVTRQTFDGQPEGGWYPHQRITMAETLKAYTWGSAYVENCEKEFGTLKEGLYADIVVLDRNLFEIEPAEILKTTVQKTIMDGKLVYEKTEEK